MVASTMSYLDIANVRDMVDVPSPPIVSAANMLWLRRRS